MFLPLPWSWFVMFLSLPMPWAPCSRHYLLTGSLCSCLCPSTEWHIPACVWQLFRNVSAGFHFPVSLETDSFYSCLCTVSGSLCFSLCLITSLPCSSHCSVTGFTYLPLSIPWSQASSWYLPRSLVISYLLNYYCSLLYSSSYYSLYVLSYCIPRISLLIFSLVNNFLCSL